MILRRPNLNAPGGQGWGGERERGKERGEEW